jgi:beta-glucosidase/6-phospho-beta-glucosidase/beta-galactosidase
MVCHEKPGAIKGNDTGDIACDHYHRWREDVALMRALGLKSYRFSVSWPRVLPQGTGTVNTKGLDFYDQLVDGLLDWLVVIPDALYWGIRFTTERYGRKPVIVTENGVCTTDWVALNGEVPDPLRIDYLSRYLLSVRRALDEGYEVAGYTCWSLMDNFEWAEGYAPRFGLIHIDYATLKRTPKHSYHWYRDLIASNGATLKRP